MYKCSFSLIYEGECKIKMREIPSKWIECTVKRASERTSERKKKRIIKGWNGKYLERSSSYAIQQRRRRRREKKTSIKRRRQTLIHEKFFCSKSVHSNISIFVVVSFQQQQSFFLIKQRFQRGWKNFNNYFITSIYTLLLPSTTIVQ